MAIPLWVLGGAGAVVLGGAVLLDGDPRDFLAGGGHPAAPGCAIPVEMHLGEIDPRFELEPDEVRRALDAAVAMWETHTEERLFTARDGEGMAVRLVFDERQAGAMARERSRAQLDQAQADIDDARERLDRHRSALNADVELYERGVRGFDERRRAHEGRVADWNAGRGERSAQARERLEREARELREEHERLEERRRGLEDRRSDLNAAGRDLEREIAAFNEQVDQFNRTAAAGSGFDMAIYQQQGNRRSITVYKASDIDELRLTLAHELGHALGIGHVDDPAAVMHAELGPANAGREDLAAADRAALVESCGVELVKP
ncbi:matrixin family metalloprotease [Thioalkalivibrio sp. ALJ9]|uniref:matrixin family metalloprotease n=1 Tax=Thioalkalivibrio sp. ALJ9 TaxID=1158758 RepID=UPI0003A92BE3|nr:matrixin family metalloprotease [Thioalkalivibrio sp. ALJ9]